MTITKFGEIGFGKISNVKTLEGDASCFYCDVELYDETGSMEVVQYVARANDITTGKWVYQQIINGNFHGEVTHVPSNISPSTGEPLVDQAPIEAKRKRNQLLSSTDWTQNADILQATKDKWAPYRQALRDVPQQSGFPHNIVWPTPPQ
jgi:hypothetical protein